MTVKLGVFAMPFHHPDRVYAELLAEDQEAVILADRLGFSEYFVGEHFSSWTERITSPLMFLASVISRTKQIHFATGVLNLLAPHPALVAAHAAQFDQLCGGRFIMGIGPGGLDSDVELFGIDPSKAREMMLESIDTILKLWSQDPPYECDGKYWKASIRDKIAPQFKVGWVPRPLQQPHPPIALSMVTPESSSANLAGERGWLPVSGNFFHHRYLRNHWERYATGCESVGRRPNPDDWRVARCILVTQTDAEADAYLADTTNGMQYYYEYFRHSFLEKRKALFMLKPDLDMSDEATSVDVIKRSQVIAGSPRRVLEQLVALREESGHFGTLLMTGHDWDDPGLWRRSMELLATEVMPAFGRHAEATRPR